MSRNADRKKSLRIKLLNEIKAMTNLITIELKTMQETEKSHKIKRSARLKAMTMRRERRLYRKMKSEHIRKREATKHASDYYRWARKRRYTKKGRSRSESHRKRYRPSSSSAKETTDNPESVHSPPCKRERISKSGSPSSKDL